MDFVTSLACLLLGIALPLTSTFVLVRRGWRQFAVAEAYGDVSRRLGLPVDTRGVSLHGHVGDRRLWVGEVMVGHGPDRRMMCWGVLDLDLPLGLGLLLRRRGLSERVFRRARSPEVALPDEQMERLLEVHGDDPVRVRALLDAPVLEALAHLVGRWRDVVVTDQTIRVHLKQPLATTRELQDLVDGLFDLADRLHVARAHVPMPAALDVLQPGLTSLGEQLGLDLIPHLPALEGWLDERRVVVVPSRSVRGYSVHVRVFRAPGTTRRPDGREVLRELGLLVRPQVEPDGYWSVGQDIQLDDEAFDRSFVVKGWDPDAIRAAFDADVRGNLCLLGGMGRVEVDDLHLRVRGLPLDPEVIERALRLGVETVRRLDAALSPEEASPASVAPPP